MNITPFKQSPLLLSVALMIGWSGSAQAETLTSDAVLNPSTAPVITTASDQPISISESDRLTLRPTPSNILPDSVSNSPSDATSDAIAPETVAPEQVPGEPVPDPSVPGTPTPQSQNQSSTQVAQTVTPGRATASGSSYIGIGGNIGIGDGDTALGEGSFAVISKIGLTNYLSVRPSVLFSDDPTILIPVTFDFSSSSNEVTANVSEDIGLSVSPFLGAGIAISTGGDGSVDFLGTAGVDVPLSPRFTATASVNASLFDNIAVGLLLGVGFNF